MDQETIDEFCPDDKARTEFVLIIEPLVALLQSSPDPEMALNNMERLASAVADRCEFYRDLNKHPSHCDLLTRLCGTSQSLSDTLVSNPQYLAWLYDAGVLRAPRGKKVLAQELAEDIKACATREDKTVALAKFKKKETLRIGSRDILGQTPLETTTEDISDLADVLVESALDLAWKDCASRHGCPMEETLQGLKEARFAVIGMGKLGGRELNYSSDIDVMFVYSGEGPVHADDRTSKTARSTGKGAMTSHEYFNLLSEQIVQILTVSGGEGSVYRVDIRLRPEGETGPMSRSLESYETYYATWGEAWEKLALIKARTIAGDSGLGDEFIAMTRPFVYQKNPGPGAIEEIRKIKARIEARLAAEGTTLLEVKLGYGGIREIEFSIQMLQLLYGGQDKSLRGSNSLKTIDALEKAGRIELQDGKRLKDAYRFLRRVEHFIQIVHEFQIHQLPSEPVEMEKLARRVGYRDGRTSAAARLAGDYKEWTEFVHAFHVRVFGPELSQGKASEVLEFLFEEETTVAAREYLAKAGFADPEKARSILGILAHGPSYMHLSNATVREFVHLSGRLLELLKNSPDPDLALNEFEKIVNAQWCARVSTRFYARTISCWNCWW